MTTPARAAICRGNAEPFKIEDVELDDLRPDELRVRVVACGVCHTDMAVRDEQLPVPLPVVLGHEGAGIVEAVGSDVTVAKPGDRVVMSFNSCGECPSCAIDAPTYCYNFFPHNWSGTRADGSPVMFKDGEPMNANFFGQSSFATHAIVPQRTAVKMDKDLPLEKLGPLGCGVVTGAGGVIEALKVGFGDSIAVMGTGGVGLSAVMAAKLVGAKHIVAVDLSDERLELARELGATHTFRGDQENLADAIRKVTGRGMQFSFNTTNAPPVHTLALEVLAMNGTAGFVAAPLPDANGPWAPQMFAMLAGGRQLRGILGGDANPRTFLPQLADYWRQGRLPFDRMLKFYPFKEIERAWADAKSGAAIKPVLLMENSDDA